MAINKEKKREIVETVGQKIRNSATVVFVGFHGLSVTLATELRKSLKGEEVGLRVVKKTLLARALAEQKNLAGEVPALPGEVAMTFGNDEIAPARGVYEFGRTHKEVLKILGGIFGGRYLDAAAMTEIAAIPGREVLLGKLVNIINSPIQRLVLALNEISKTKQA